MTSTYFSIQKSSVSAKLTLPEHRRASLRGGLWLPPAQRGSLPIPEFTEQMVHYLALAYLSPVALCEGGWLGDPFHDKESEQFVARYIERAPLSLEKLSLQDDIVTYTTKDGAAHEFDALEFLAVLSVHIPKTYESITRYYGRYSCRRRGERAKLSPPPAEEHESDYSREFRKSGWAACIKRIYEIDPLECPKCNAQMRIIAFIQDQHSIKDIMKAQGIPDFHAPPPIPTFIDTSHAIDELPEYDAFEPAPDDF